MYETKPKHFRVLEDLDRFSKRLSFESSNKDVLSLRIFENKAQFFDLPFITRR